MNMYVITFPNGKRYVGVEGKTGQRKYAHSRAKYRKRSSLVSKAIIKYGWENCNFTYEIMDKTPDECYRLEIKLIAEWKLQDKQYGYNQSSGGEQGFRGVKMSEEHKAKIGLAHKGRIFSQETINKMKESQKGKKLSKEHRKNISKSLVGRTGGNTGHHHTDEHKKKMSLANSEKNNRFYGKHHTPETIAKIIASNKRRAKKWKKES